LHNIWQDIADVKEGTWVNGFSFHANKTRKKKIERTLILTHENIRHQNVDVRKSDLTPVNRRPITIGAAQYVVH
jgi:hypothetical protein